MTQGTLLSAGFTPRQENGSHLSSPRLPCAVPRLGGADALGTACAGEAAASERR